MEKEDKKLAKYFIRRTLLYVPGSSEKMIEKAMNVTADSIIFDLEDSVSLAEKDQARINVARAVSRLKETGKETIVRVNAMDSFFGIQDLISIVEKRPNTILVPKADEKSLGMADMLITNLEERYGLGKGSIRMLPLLETSYSIVNAYKILGVSKRINGVQLGAEDLTKELGTVRTRVGDEIQYARNAIVYAGCARGIDIIDTPYTGIGDEEGLVFDTERAKSLGMTGKTCIHPDQIDTINQLFTPHPKAVEEARKIIAAFNTAVSEGKGACMHEGKMIDNPVAVRAMKLVEKADLIAAFNTN